MKKTISKDMLIAGMEIRTSNDAGQAEVAIPQLWAEFMAANLASKLPDLTCNTMYALYTDYEGDHTKPYTMMLGFEVNSTHNIPEGLSVRTIPVATYEAFTAKGNLTKNAIFDTWMEIWKSDLKRTYKTDIEVYGDKAIDPTNGEAEIWIGVE
ncbi:MAG: GyrI-like domain-containing protein [Salibacteraceae bacterium]